MEKWFTQRREQKEGAKYAEAGRSPCNSGQLDAASAEKETYGAALHLCAFESFAPLREPRLRVSAPLRLCVNPFFSWH